MPNQTIAKPTFAAPAAQSSLAKDSFWSLLSEGIAVPCLVISAAILSRTLKAEGMGQYSIALTFAQWFQFAAVAGLVRIGSQVITRQGDEWRTAAGSVMSAFLISGAVMMILGMALASLVAHVLKVADLTPYLLFICLNVLLFSVQTGMRTVLAATGRFKERSYVAIVFWVTRIALSAALVLSGWHLWGAMIGFVGSSVFALLVGLYFVRFPLRLDKSIFLKLLPAMPLLIGALCMQIVEKMDVFLIKALGYSMADAGLFSVAKNISGIPCLLAFAVAPVVVTAASKHLAADRPDLALSVERQTLNILLLTLPFGAVMGTTGQELISVVYGGSFAPAAIYLAPLFINAMFLMVTSVNSALLTTHYFIRFTVTVSVSTLLLNLALQPFAIKTFGMFGCGCMELAISILALICTAVYGWNKLRLAFSLRTLGNTALVFSVALIVGSVWAAPLPIPGLKLILVSLMVLALYFALRDPVFLHCLQQFKHLPGFRKFAGSK